MQRGLEISHVRKSVRDEDAVVATAGAGKHQYRIEVPSVHGTPETRPGWFAYQSRQLSDNCR